MFSRGPFISQRTYVGWDGHRYAGCGDLPLNFHLIPVRLINLNVVICVPASPYRGWDSGKLATLIRGSPCQVTLPLSQRYNQFFKRLFQPTYILFFDFRWFFLATRFGVFDHHDTRFHPAA